MRKTGSIGLLAVCLTLGAVDAGDTWPQWGGVNRNFTVEPRTLSRNWGEDGPPELWSRPLGGGFAGISSDGKSLYSAYRAGDEEIVVALDPRTGKTRWEYRYDAPIPKADYLSTQYGKGPNGTPLVFDGKVVTLGFMGHVVCMDAKKGKLLWSHDLGADFDARIPYFGHATSPLALGDNVLIVAGGLHAFDLATGKAVWSNNEFQGSYGSPVIVDVGDRQQIVTPVESHLAGFAPETGKTLWSIEHKNQWGTILTTPVIDDSGRVFISAAQVGAMLVDPSAHETQLRVWATDATKINHSNAVRVEDVVYASVGGSASFMTATSLTDGKQAWKKRGFATANLIRVGDEFLLLDFEGELALVEMDGSGMNVITRATINERPTWTPPTLIGSTLFFRDETRIVALDLSVAR
jgi:outer membrane protein assembly factor BamB